MTGRLPVPLGGPASSEPSDMPPALQLKVRPPACPRDLVVRNRLLERLDEGTKGRCTLVAAGPGYGKSVLMASYLAHQDRFSRVAWLTLDPVDADPQRLVAHLVAALQEPFRSSPEAAAEPLLQLRRPPSSASRTFLDDALLPALESVRESILLVVDDVHNVGSSPGAVGILDVLLRWAPPPLRLVMAGRADPPLGLQRLRLAGQLTTLRQKDLACTREETEAVLRASGLRLAPAEVRALHELTQGWPAALRLSVLSILEHGAVPQLLERFLAHDLALADYLTSEVLQGLPDTLRDFVVRATIDPIVCGSLVDAVCGSTGTAAATLAECERRNLFLTRVRDDQEEWYAWHHMFAGQMQRRLELDDPAGARECHLTAARWWCENDPARAAQHAVAGRDPGLTARIVAEAWVDLALAGESRTLLDLLDMLPEQPEHPAELRLASCYAHMLEAETARATADLQAAVAARSQVPAATRWRFDALAAWLRFLLVERHTALREAVDEAGRVLEEAPDDAAATAGPAYALALLAVGMGEARLQENLPSAITRLRAAAETGRRSGLEVLELVARAELCIPLIAEGRLTDIERAAHDIVAEARRRGWEDFGPVSVPLGYLGWLAYWRGDVAEARRTLARASEICPTADWSSRGLLAYFHARACLAAGDVEVAVRDLAEARALTDAGCVPPYTDSMLAGLEAEVLTATGDLAAAFAAVDGGDGPEYRMTAATRADLLRRRGRAEESLSVLDGLVDQPFPHIRVLEGVLRALALHDLAQGDASHAALERALAAAQPAALMGPFLARADDLALLLDAHVRRGTSHEGFTVLLAERMAQPVAQAATGRHARLTQRELSILRYLRTSMPNAEIAAELYVSVNTVKTHAAAIYRKLGVSSRRHAVHRAEALGLFGSSPLHGPPVPPERLQARSGVSTVLLRR